MPPSINQSRIHQRSINAHPHAIQFDERHDYRGECIYFNSSSNKPNRTYAGAIREKLFFFKSSDRKSRTIPKVLTHQSTRNSTGTSTNSTTRTRPIQRARTATRATYVPGRRWRGRRPPFPPGAPPLSVPRPDPGSSTGPAGIAAEGGREGGDHAARSVSGKGGRGCYMRRWREGKRAGGRSRGPAGGREGGGDLKQAGGGGWSLAVRGRRVAGSRRGRPRRRGRGGQSEGGKRWLEFFLVWFPSVSDSRARVCFACAFAAGAGRVWVWDSGIVFFFSFFCKKTGFGMMDLINRLLRRGVWKFGVMGGNLLPVHVCSPA